MAELPLQLPGEPDALAEVRLGAELKLLRSLATQHGRTLKFREMALKQWPGVYEAMEILEPPPHFIREALAIAPRLKERLLQVEAYFIERGWHLPKWERPSWLVE